MTTRPFKQATNLSIIIPTCRQGTIIECIKALRHNDAEIIVVDDGSPEIVTVPDRARVIRHEQRRGQAAAKNTGMRAASHDLVLIIEDDILAAPDMVTRLLDEYSFWENTKTALIGRVVWHPKLPLTLTMKWFEEAGPFHDVSCEDSGPLADLWSGNTLLWRPFVLEHGGFDEQFIHHGMEDFELGMRLKKHGLQIHLVAPAVGYRRKSMRVRDLANREREQGLSAVYLHSKFPEYVPQVDDLAGLLQNEKSADEAEAAAAQLSLLEESGAAVAVGADELFLEVYRYNFLHGILSGLREIGGLKARRQKANTLAIYNHASYLESQEDFDEARRLFNLVVHRPDEEYWADAEYHLGRIEEKLGNVQAAHTHMTECVRLDPEYRMAGDST